jgi:hypothetical protein
MDPATRTHTTRPPSLCSPPCRFTTLVRVGASGGENRSKVEVSIVLESTPPTPRLSNVAPPHLGEGRVWARRFILAFCFWGLEKINRHSWHSWSSQSSFECLFRKSVQFFYKKSISAKAKPRPWSAFPLRSSRPPACWASLPVLSRCLIMVSMRRASHLLQRACIRLRPWLTPPPPDQ